MFISIIFSWLLLGSPLVYGQDSTRSSVNTSFGQWAAYKVHFKIHPKWVLSADAQFRFQAPDCVGLRRSVFRLSTGYKLSKGWMLGGGYATFLHKDCDMPQIAPEQRVFFQIHYRARYANKIMMSHRLRTEHRAVPEVVQDLDSLYRLGNWEYKDRLRYALTVKIPLHTYENRHQQWYAAFGQELMFSFSNVSDGQWLDRWRVAGAIGFKFSKHVRLDLTYVYQIRFSKLQVSEMQHVARVRMITVLKTY